MPNSELPLANPHSAQYDRPRAGHAVLVLPQGLLGGVELMSLDGETAREVIDATEQIYVPDTLTEHRTVVVSMTAVDGSIRPVEIPADAYTDPERGPETFRKELFENCYVLVPPIGSNTWGAIRAAWERSVPRGIGEATEVRA